MGAILFTFAERMTDGKGHTILSQPYVSYIGIPFWVLFGIFIGLCFKNKNPHGDVESEREKKF